MSPPIGGRLRRSASLAARLGSLRWRGWLVAFACFGSFGAAPLAAADLGIEVRDKGGRPVQGAAVTIAGPAGATQLGRTSDIGRVVFADLAPGEWSVTIEHPEFMLFNGWVDARPGKVAKETFSTQVATERSWVPIRVSYFAPASRDARAVQPAPPQAVVAAPPPPAAPPSPGPATPAPTPRVAPPSAEVPKAPTQASEPIPQAAPAAVAPPKPALPPGVPSAAPAPPVAPPVAPAPVAAPHPPGAGAKGPSPYRSRALGTCPECKPGEWAASAQVAALAGAGCEAGQAERLSAEFNSAAAETTGEVWSSGTAPCRLLAVRLPPGSRFLGYRFEAEDNRRAADCVGGEPCPVGEARFLGHPSVRKGDGAWIWAIFENRAGAPRLARLTAFFSAPAGWQAVPLR